MLHPEIIRRFGRDPKVVFERDGWKCLICGSNECLTVDHIDGNGRNSRKPNNKLSNLRTLCRRCHGRIDIKKRWVYCRRVERVCAFCGKMFTVSKCEIKHGRGIHCSRSCSMKNNIKKGLIKRWG